ncbi:MAG: glycosyltransferase family 2 protein [Anaerolineae bacterium]|nr:MAG: glycosyltransferase family 2 protein [Anaerolineae bacterium]
MAATNKLAIVLVNWNNKNFIDQCLQSIKEAELPFKYETIVSDNGSSDGSLRMINENYPEVKIIQNDENVGVATGNNQGIKNSSSEFIYILNNDTKINGPSVIEMITFLEENPEAGAVGGNLLNPDGTLQSSFFKFPTLLEEFLIVSHIGKKINLLHPSHNGKWPQAREVDWLSSASIIVRRKAFEVIALLDEDFFVYSDETDWQYRLWQAGWRVHYLPSVNTIHYGGGSFKPGERRFTLVYRGRMLFANKHYSMMFQIIQRFMFGIFAALRLFVWMLLYLVPGRRDFSGSQIKSNIEIISLSIHLK